MKLKKIIIAVSVLFAINSYADPIDLSSWSELTLNFPGGQNAGNWQLSADKTSVIQQINADPSFYLNNINQTSYSMDGSWQVLTGSDDDYMGFVFGYQNSSNFYLFDWKQGSQSYSGTYANEGMTIKKMTGATGDGLTDLSLAEFWENGSDYGDMDILAQNHGPAEGWLDGQLYDFHLDFNLTPGDIHIEILQNGVSLWDVTVHDNTFTAGQFGFYNYSQQSVRYAGFEQTGGEEVPEPAFILLFGFGLLGLRRITKRK